MRSDGIIRFWRRIGAHNICVIGVDLIMLLLAVYLSYALRFSIFLGNASHYGLARVALFYVGAVMLSFALCGVYRVYWLQTSVEELMRLCFSYLGACAGLGAVYFLTEHSVLVPRSVMGLLAFSGIVFLVIVRLTWRLTGNIRKPGLLRKALVLGAGEAGVLLVRDLKRNGSDMGVVGFLDDDPLKLKKVIAGFPVLGSMEKLPDVVKRYGIEDVLVAIPSASGVRMRGLLDQIIPLGVVVRILPTLRDLADGSVSVSQLRPVSLEDLLSRDPVELDTQQIGQLLRSKDVMITGAGGSIGGEIVRQLLPYNPRTLILIGHGEQSIYTLMEEIQGKNPSVALVPVIADVADRDSMARVFYRWHPSVVFHAAAHKHVPLMETNEREAVRVNCLGSWTVGDLAGLCGVSRMVLISTDKAVNPSSIMGASKRIAEMALMDLQKRYPQTAYMAVRFGNVLGSRGSVIPKFEKQIAAGGPVTVTHPDMCRYFMLIPEAAGLVLQTAAIGLPGRIYVLDMGKPVKIVTLAETLIRLHGCVPGRDIDICFTGMRPGEKLFEELFYDRSHVDATPHPKIFCARIFEDREQKTDMLERVKQILSAEEPRSVIAETVPEYRHSP